MKRTALYLSLFLLASNTMGATYYVSLTGSDTPPYSNWGTSATTIQAAVDTASDGDGRDDVASVQFTTRPRSSHTLPTTPPLTASTPPTPFRISTWAR